MQGRHLNQLETAGPARRRGFTLTELLIVIAIIGVLAALIAAAATNALRNARRARILLEIKNVGGSLENFKNERGAYPPNCMHDGSNQMITRVASDVERMARKAFPRINPQELEVFRALANGQQSNSVVTQTSPNFTNGMTAAEAFFFWLGGFSDDPQFPLSGQGGPSYLVSSTTGEILEDRKPAYAFDLSRLGPRTENGLDYDNVDYILYTISMNGVQQNRRINLWYYHADGSEQPYVYFDASRYKPSQYDMWAANPSGSNSPPVIYPFLQYRQGFKGTSPQLTDVVFVNQKKFQILHPGLDDTWGPAFQYVGKAPFIQNPTSDVTLLFPTGPFLAELADTLTNFTDGPLEDSQVE